VIYSKTNTIFYAMVKYKILNKEKQGSTSQQSKGKEELNVVKIKIFI